MLPPNGQDRSRESAGEPYSMNIAPEVVRPVTTVSIDWTGMRPRALMSGSSVGGRRRGGISMWVSIALPHRGISNGSVVDGGVLQDSTARIRPTFGSLHERACSAVFAGTPTQ